MGDYRLEAGGSVMDLCFIDVYQNFLTRDVGSYGLITLSCMIGV